MQYNESHDPLYPKSPWLPKSFQFPKISPQFFQIRQIPQISSNRQISSTPRIS